MHEVQAKNRYDVRDEEHKFKYSRIKEHPRQGKQPTSALEAECDTVKH